MRVRVHDSDGGVPPAGPSDADAGERESGRERAAHDDLDGWLRGLVWTLGPVAPSIGISGGPIEGGCRPGGHCRVSFDVVNRQSASTAMVFRPSALRSDDGTVWWPSATASSAVVVGPGERRRARITIDVPESLPTGTYRGVVGALELYGPGAPLVLDVADAVED